MKDSGRGIVGWAALKDGVVRMLPLPAYSSKVSVSNYFLGGGPTETPGPLGSPSLGCIGLTSDVPQPPHPSARATH